MRTIVKHGQPVERAKGRGEEAPVLLPHRQREPRVGGRRLEALDPGERGAGDIAFISHLIPGLDGLGAKGGNSHAAGEWTDLESMPMLIKRTAVLIYRLTR